MIRVHWLFDGEPRPAPPGLLFVPSPQDGENARRAS